MRLIVIGASGLIGGQLYAAGAAAGRSVIGTYSESPKPGLLRLDLRAQRLREVVPDLNEEDVVYLLSAYSNPSWIFAHQPEAQALNVDGTKRAVDDVKAAGARLVFMSSVEVFDGATGGYGEEAIPNPLNAYGKMKYLIEQYISATGSGSCVVRTGWNIGWTAAHRCVVKLTYETLLKPGATMATDNTFSVADVRDTARGLLALSERKDIEKLHLASRPTVFRTELANEIIASSARGRQMGYKDGLFRDIPYSEPRARLNHLDTTRAVRELGLTFRPALEIVRDKVRLLDNQPVD